MPYNYKEFRRRKLPHIHPPGANLFVTFRLAGSIPKAVLARYESERQWLEHELTRVSNENHQRPTVEVAKHEQRLRAFYRRRFAEFETILDKAEYGPTWLKEPRIAKMVAASLRYRDGKIYRLDAYCIMSNHVHVTFEPHLNERSLIEKPTTKGLMYESKDPPLDVIMHSLKSFTANQANKILQRNGQFWETESYDHVIKNASEFQRIKSYILNNPVKAGLVKNWREWPWSWLRT